MSTSRPTGASALALLLLPSAALPAGSVATPATPAQQTQVPATLTDFFLPGTQPNELNQPIFESSSCVVCHANYDPDHEPYEQWAASMMGQAGRDPIFDATLALASQDVDFGGEACLRCHAPGAWLDVRSTPTDGSSLDPLFGDLDGVNCHFCHRLVDPVPDADNPAEDPSILAGLVAPALEEPYTCSFVFDPDDNRCGPFELVNFNFHQCRKSPFHQESLMRATCDDVSNPLLEEQLDGPFQLGDLDSPHPTARKRDMFPV